MRHLWVIGGVQDRQAGVLDRDHKPLYGLGRVVKLDVVTGTAQIVLDWRHPEGDGHALKGATATLDGLLLCGQKRVVAWTPTQGITDSWSHPFLHDAHHALHHDGALWVTSTAADGIVRRKGTQVDFFPVVLGATGDKPRAKSRAHPNHLFIWRGRLWVTRLHLRDAVEVEGTGRIALGDERIHDGVVVEDTPWFTAVDGHLVTPERAYDLKPLDPRTGPLGWCRGLVIDGAVAWVGFSRLRATRWRSHLAWVRGQMRGKTLVTSHPTRVTGYDLDRGTVVGDWPVPLDAVFGLVPVAG